MRATVQVKCTTTAALYTQACSQHLWVCVMSSGRIFIAVEDIHLQLEVMNVVIYGLTRHSHLHISEVTCSTVHSSAIVMYSC